MSVATLHVAETGIPGQQTRDGDAFPLVLECRSPGIGLGAVTAAFAAHAGELIDRAARHGAVLFRGFPVATADDFDAFVAAFGLPNFPYYQSLSNAVRVNRTPRVFTANEAPPEVSIYLHHEMAQTPVYPSRLFFFCEQPATTGGATPICRSDVLWERLSERCAYFCRDLEAKGLRYSHVMPPTDDATSGMGRSWQSTLRADSPANAERLLSELGYSWEWLPDGSLRATTPTLPAVRRLSNGRTSFFNQLIAASRGWKSDQTDPITYGDGSPLDRSGVAEAARLGDELAFDIPWQKGDVVLVDNFVTMHGRRTFTGTRKVLASLIAADRG
ncbi:MAG TPA: TauD/TfdA family dioxygenase [Gemmataceae bacterium]|nr:TauD/TfdA family dioxygenase [Gemmataceae bacterium]